MTAGGGSAALDPTVKQGRLTFLLPAARRALFLFHEPWAPNASFPQDKHLHAIELGKLPASNASTAVEGSRALRRSAIASFVPMGSEGPTN